MADRGPGVGTERHVAYFLRCLDLLPYIYTSNDLNRITLAYFCIVGLDLLHALQDVPLEKKEAWKDWIYRCQAEGGGFRGSPQVEGLGRRYDPGHLPSTYFALAALVSLRDDLTRVDWEGTLHLIRRLQRKDGSFAPFVMETVDGQGEELGGEVDMRFTYCASAVRYILRGNDCKVEDVKVDSAVDYVKSSINYDGGIGQGPGCESHAGLTYCGVAALSLLGRVDALSNLRQTIRFLTSLQNQVNAPPTEDADAASDDEDEYDPGGGFCGRHNKMTDTCYSFWVSGSLSLLPSTSNPPPMDLIDKEANRKYLLQHTQHKIGGFGKNAGDPPDVLHSCLGLASLAVQGEERLQGLDGALCVAEGAREFLATLRTGHATDK
ncbi:terpenoid cyclases/Protein prenyltransferase [Saitoella complicata NRRL Y-17804]|uniref:Geranylgeranyl transferase type-1 subunit beta n=1 Tax=Saitoella complicata (strain BCRC 22490 / CBS 7301 / JCM 7358 / NBRC 10748 / NRRL Y-17804) TaxID=698492 RepID=A0A0E9NB88_SAICN|nr:terpenoid cyclases/Protein prenyltransferase [Saitoella complicata NRRL Y-17804]ODQ55233.1 terpenoid cyclases/Protein prenyltransferase [Saitoella complicata NRRL Y-17804]GAO47068.1 hypothetical protein G7K_1280-t1 [Saitoella complicata NRRL Y-17804]